MPYLKLLVEQGQNALMVLNMYVSFLFSLCVCGGGGGGGG